METDPDSMPHFREFLFAALLKPKVKHIQQFTRAFDFREFLFAALLKLLCDGAARKGRDHFREFLFAALLKPVASLKKPSSFVVIFPRISIRGFIEADGMRRSKRRREVDFREFLFAALLKLDNNKLDELMSKEISANFYSRLY